MASDEVFLDDAFEVFGIAGMIPNGIGVDYGDGAADADAEAVGLCAMDEGLGAAEFEFVESFFEEFPGDGSGDVITAFCFVGGGTEEDVLLVAVEVEGLGGVLELVGHFIELYEERRAGCRFRGDRRSR